MINMLAFEGVVSVDPKLVEFDGDRCLLDFRVGHPRSWIGNDGRERSEWVHLDCKVLSAKRARALAKIIHKGMRLAVTGELRETTREGESGNRYFHWVYVIDVSLPVRQQTNGTTSAAQGATKAAPKVTVLTRQAEPDLAGTSERPNVAQQHAAEAMTELGIALEA